jgi:pimeloyl-ACP methyl ester carboxylesterase
MQVSLPNSGVKVVSDRGSGRVFIALLDDLAYLPLAESVAKQISEKGRALVVVSAPVGDETWESLSESLSRTIEEIGIRQVSLVGFGAGATLAQNLTLARPKLVRILAVVDAASRPHLTRWERFVDWLEEKLPFGLPLRLGGNGFNIKSYVHRLRAPLLVVGTSRASQFVLDELECLAALAPTAWRVMLCESEREREAAALTSTLLSFYDTPAKCPQKNLGAVA